MVKTLVKLNFTDFYGGFSKTDNFFYRKLSEKYTVLIDEKNPDYIIYSCFGSDFLKYDCIRIFYTGENVHPNFNLCDYAIGFDHLTFLDRYIRFPNFATYEGQVENLLTPQDFNGAYPTQKKFCNFIYSNKDSHPVRDNFFKQLSEYKRIDSPGKHLNNMQHLPGGNGWHKRKVEFQKNYKFSIAFENSSTPGYTTEKLMHSFLAGSIPIYWGNPLVGLDFNPDSFINCHNYKSLKEVVARVAELDNNDQLYRQVVNQPIFTKVPNYLTDGYLIHFFDNIFSQPIQLAARRNKYCRGRMYEEEYTHIAENNKLRQNLGYAIKQVARLSLQKILITR